MQRKIPYTYGMKYGKFLLWGLLLALVAVAPVLADAADKNAAELLTLNLYCDGRDLLQGSIGLLIGLIFVTVGVWKWIDGAKAKTIAFYMIMGGVVTAVPSLINSFLGGYNDMLANSGIGVAADDFSKFGDNCDAGTVERKKTKADAVAAGVANAGML